MPRTVLVVLLLVWCVSGGSLPNRVLVAGDAVLAVSTHDADTPALRSPAAAEQLARLWRPSFAGPLSADAPVRFGVETLAPFGIVARPRIRRRRVPARRFGRAPDEPS